jgi:hypothetical protein
MARTRSAAGDKQEQPAEPGPVDPDTRLADLTVGDLLRLVSMPPSGRAVPPETKLGDLTVGEFQQLAAQLLYAPPAPGSFPAWTYGAPPPPWAPGGMEGGYPGGY